MSFVDKVSKEEIEDYFCHQNRGDGLTLAGSQVPTKPLSLPVLRMVGGENKVKNLVGQDKNRMMAY